MYFGIHGETSPLEWPTVKMVLDRVKKDGSEDVYQGVALKRYDTTTLSYCCSEALTDLERLTEKMHEQLEWSDANLLREFYLFSLKLSDDESDESDVDSSLEELKAAIELISSQFRDPFEATGVSVSSLQDKIEDAVGSTPKTT